jgi:soluble lytic murein transglycosylase-like protein
MGDIDVSLLEAIIMTESSGDPNAYNPKSGARGLTQITPIAWKDLVNHFPSKYRDLDYKTDIFRPDVSRRAGADYLAIIKKYLKNSDMPITTDNILSAYNWGIGNLKKYGLGNAPKETLKYIQKVNNYLVRSK